MSWPAPPGHRFFVHQLRGHDIAEMNHSLAIVTNTAGRRPDGTQRSLIGDKQEAKTRGKERCQRREKERENGVEKQPCLS